MANIIVLGAGMVGSAMAIDLESKHQVTVSDMNQERLDFVKNKKAGIQTILLNVTDHQALHASIAPFDLVICAVPGFLGYETLRHIILCGKNVVDISFFPEDALSLHDLALQNNVTAIVDCGVAPGMGNLILGRYNALLELTDFECLVGGLPKIKKWPFCYKAPFSPIDVIEEYTRPARYVADGKIVVVEALTEPELIEFENAGILEAFNTDGLRSVLFTMPHIKNRKEKTLRYPGHIEYIRVLKESGFFDTKKITISGTEISPLEFTSKILINEWKLGDTEPELTVMRITLVGKNKNGVTEKIIYNLYDEYNPQTQTSSMARTTGYTATAAANMILENLFTEKGVFPPELIGHNEHCFNFIMTYLRERNVIYKKTTESI